MSLVNLPICVVMCTFVLSVLLCTVSTNGVASRIRIAGLVR